MITNQLRHYQDIFREFHFQEISLTYMNTNGDEIVLQAYFKVKIASAYIYSFEKLFSDPVIKIGMWKLF